MRRRVKRVVSCGLVGLNVDGASVEVSIRERVDGM
jgi:hypothetical protein